MYYSTHLVTGAVAGLLTNHPVKAFIVGLASHIMLDMIPHHDHEKVRICALDVIGGTIVFILWFTYYQPGLNVLVGAIAGVLPDIEVPLYYFNLISKRYFPSHNGWTPHSKSIYPNGIVIQLLIVGFGMWVIS